MKKVIKKGNHRSSYINPILIGADAFNREYSVILGESCKYEDKPEYTINKLLGISCIFHNENWWILKRFKKYINSLSIGYKYNSTSGYFDIYQYFDREGVEHRYKSNHKIRLNERFTVLFRIFKTNFYNHKEKEYQMGYIITCYINNNFFANIFVNKPLIGYMLYPYFGGKSTAPHNMTFYIKRIR